MNATQKKTTTVTPEMLDGPMMECREWSEKETKEFADYVAASKAATKMKKSKTVRQKHSA